MVTYSLKPTTEGRWNVCRLDVSLFTGLQLDAAIRLSREVARDEHLRSGRIVCVEMPGPESAIRVAQYTSAAVPIKHAA